MNHLSNKFKTCEEEIDWLFFLQCCCIISVDMRCVLINCWNIRVISENLTYLRVYIEFFLSHIQVAQETNLQSIMIQTVERIMSRKCNTAAIIELIILDCKTIMSSFRQVSFCFMSRQINVEAYRLVGIAKHVGSRIWMGHISQPWMLFLVFLFLMFFKWNCLNFQGEKRKRAPNKRLSADFGFHSSRV